MPGLCRGSSPSPILIAELFLISESAVLEMLPLLILSQCSRDLVEVSSNEGSVCRRERSISSPPSAFEGYLRRFSSELFVGECVGRSCVWWSAL